MSDTAIFVVLSTDDLSGNGQLPGGLRGLRTLPKDDERIVHLEVISDSPLSEKTASTLHGDGALVTVLPAAPDSSSALVGGLMARLHEFICAYAHVSQFILASSDSDRLSSASAFLQRAGYYVIVAGPDRRALESLRQVSDEVAVWSGRQNRDGGRDHSSREGGRDREDSAPKLDPYEVLVDEVTRSREKGQRVLLTSLKQRMRRRMRRFDETRLKDQDGRPMRKFKDFIADAANRNLIQLIENGNRSQVLLPGEDIPEESDEEENSNEENNVRNDRPSRRRTETPDKDSDSDSEVDPLLDSVDMIDAEESEPEEEEEKDLEELTVADFDVENINEDAPAPPHEFIAMLEKVIPESGWTLAELLKALSEMKSKEEISGTNREIRTMLQNSFYNELLEPANQDSPRRYIVVDDWKGIIDFL
ncbi:MAG: hypothetical protein ACO3N7_02500 [Kiritimatiellia bacterium]